MISYRCVNASPASQPHRVQGVHILHIGVLARPVDGADDVEGPIGHDFDIDPRLLEITIGQRRGDARLQRLGGIVLGPKRADQRQEPST